jgi:hypothetical protein
MSGSEWDDCENPNTLIDYTCTHADIEYKKMLLFATRCCRIMLKYFADERSKHAIAVAEQYALGNATEDDTDRAFDDAELAWDELNVHWPSGAHQTACYIAQAIFRSPFDILVPLAHLWAHDDQSHGNNPDYKEYNKCFARCFREIFSYPGASVFQKHDK